MLMSDMRSPAARGDHRRAGAARGDRPAGLMPEAPGALVQALDAFVDVLSRHHRRDAGIRSRLLRRALRGDLSSDLDRARCDLPLRRRAPAGARRGSRRASTSPSSMACSRASRFSARRAARWRRTSSSRRATSRRTARVRVHRRRTACWSSRRWSRRAAGSGSWSATGRRTRRRSASPSATCCGRSARPPRSRRWRGSRRARRARAGARGPHRHGPRHPRWRRSSVCSACRWRWPAKATLDAARAAALRGRDPGRARGAARAPFSARSGALSRPTGTTLAAELERLAERAPGARHRARGRPAEVPERARAARAVGARRGDAQRPEARAPADRRVHVGSEDDAFMLVVTNDGVTRGRDGVVGHGAAPRGARGAAAGGVVEFGRASPRRWQVRLVVPIDGRRAEPSAPSAALRVLIVDDHDVVHWGFRLMLGQLPWVERCTQRADRRGGRGAGASATSRTSRSSTCSSATSRGRDRRAAAQRSPSRRGSC